MSHMSLSTFDRDLAEITQSLIKFDRDSAEITYVSTRLDILQLISGAIQVFAPSESLP